MFSAESEKGHDNDGTSSEPQSKLAETMLYASKLTFIIFGRKAL